MTILKKNIARIDTVISPVYITISDIYIII